MSHHITHSLKRCPGRGKSRKVAASRWEVRQTEQRGIDTGFLKGRLGEVFQGGLGLVDFCSLDFGASSGIGRISGSWISGTGRIPCSETGGIQWLDSGASSGISGILSSGIGGILQADCGASSEIGRISGPSPGVKSGPGVFFGPGLGSSQVQGVLSLPYSPHIPPFLVY